MSLGVQERESVSEFRTKYMKKAVNLSGIRERNKVGFLK